MNFSRLIDKRLSSWSCSISFSSFRWFCPQPMIVSSHAYVEQNSVEYYKDTCKVSGVVSICSFLLLNAQFCELYPPWFPRTLSSISSTQGICWALPRSPPTPSNALLVLQSESFLRTINSSLRESHFSDITPSLFLMWRANHCAMYFVWLFHYCCFMGKGKSSLYCFILIKKPSHLY